MGTVEARFLRTEVRGLLGSQHGAHYSVRQATCLGLDPWSLTMPPSRSYHAAENQPSFQTVGLGWEAV